MAAFVLCRRFRSESKVLQDCSLSELRVLQTEKWMISAEGRYCSNRVLMLTRVKGCCHYLGAEGAVTVKCTVTAYNCNYTVLLCQKGLLKLVQAYDYFYENEWMTLVKNHIHSGLCLWMCSGLWIHFVHELLRTCLCFLILHGVIKRP